MNRLLIFLDGPSIEGLLSVGFLFILLPIAAIVLLIYIFIKRKNKNK